MANCWNGLALSDTIVTKSKIKRKAFATKWQQVQKKYFVSVNSNRYWCIRDYQVKCVSYCLALLSYAVESKTISKVVLQRLNVYWNYFYVNHRILSLKPWKSARHLIFNIDRFIYKFIHYDRKLHFLSKCFPQTIRLYIVIRQCIDIHISTSTLIRIKAGLICQVQHSSLCTRSTDFCFNDCDWVFHFFSFAVILHTSVK